MHLANTTMQYRASGIPMKLVCPGLLISPPSSSLISLSFSFRLYHHRFMGSHSPLLGSSRV